MTDYPDFHGDMPLEHANLKNESCACSKKCKCDKNCNCKNCDCKECNPPKCKCGGNCNC